MNNKKIILPKAFLTDSLNLLKTHRTLYWFPLLNLISTTSLLFIFITMVVYPLYISEMTVHVSGVAKSFFIKIIFGILSFLLIPLVSNIFNAAIFFYTHDVIENKAASFSGSLLSALHKLPALTLWSIMQATVGFFLNLFTSTDHPFVDLIIDLFFGVAWGLISFFVLPVVLFENKNPFDAIKCSATMTKKLWGSRGMLRLGVWGITYFLLFLLGFVVIYLGFKLHDQWSFLVVALGVIYLIAIAYRCRLVSIIIQLKLYDAIKRGDVIPGIVNVVSDKPF